MVIHPFLLLRLYFMGSKMDVTMSTCRFHVQPIPGLRNFTALLPPRFAIQQRGSSMFPLHVSKLPYQKNTMSLYSSLDSPLPPQFFKVVNWGEEAAFAADKDNLTTTTVPYIEDVDVVKEDASLKGSVQEAMMASMDNFTTTPSRKELDVVKEETNTKRSKKKVLVKRIPPKRPYSAVDDERFMREALVEAQKAAKHGEVPVGAVLVHMNKIIARHHNQVETDGDPTAHAEMLCIRSAAAQLGDWRLTDVTLYVTLEPCPMCAGAILQARVGQLVWSAHNSLLGADGSWIKLFPDSSDCNQCEEGTSANSPLSRGATESRSKGYLHPFHRTIQVRRGVLADRSADIIQSFFQMRRLKTKGVDAGIKAGRINPWPRSLRWFPSVLKKLNLPRGWLKL